MDTTFNRLTAHTPWTDSQAARFRAAAYRDISRRSRLIRSAFHVLFAISSFLLAMGLFAGGGYIATPALSLAVVFPAVADVPGFTYFSLSVPLALLAFKLGTAQTDFPILLRRWEIEAGDIPLSQAQIGQLRLAFHPDDRTNAAGHAFRLWDATGVALRLRDARLLHAYCLAHDFKLPAFDIDHVAYVVDGDLRFIEPQPA